MTRSVPPKSAYEIDQALYVGDSSHAFVARCLIPGCVNANGTTYVSSVKYDRSSAVQSYTDHWRMKHEPIECPYSGLTVQECQTSDLCDCFHFPQEDSDGQKRLTARRIVESATQYEEEQKSHE